MEGKLDMCKTYNSLLSGSGSFKISLDIDKIEKNCA